MKWYNRKRKSSPDVTQQENLQNGSTKVEDGFSNSKSTTSFVGLYKYSSAHEKLLMTLGTLCAILTGLTVPMNSFIFGDLTDAMIRYSMFGGTQELWEGVNRFAIYNSVLGGVMLICSYISVATFNVAAQNQIYRIRGLFFKSVLHQEISWYDVHQTGEVASRMNEDLQKLEDGLGEKVPMFMHFIVAFFGSLILGITKGWELALVCLSSMPVTFISIGAVGMITSKLAAKESEAYAKAGSIAEEVLSAIRTVVAFGGEKIEVDRYKTNLKSAKEINIKKGYFAGLGFGLLWFFIYASYALAFWYGVGLVLEEFNNPRDEIHYTPGVMLTVFFSIMMGTMNLGLASPYIETFSVSKGAAANVFSLIEQTPSKDSRSEETIRPEGPIESISFQNVHFQYPTRPDIKVLKGINIDIHKGQTVALVGTSGCGKSTCIQLLQRFYEPSSGSILLNGRDVREIDVQWIRARIGIVSQEPVLFGTTVYENILFGNSSAEAEDIEKAAKAANAHEFIKNLPSGYETLIGERGAQLSGGQKQRIAIARALVRDPEILLLDEATSALDLASEAKVQHALEVASKGRTTIVVAHRLSTVINADKIIVLNDGKIMEAGTHSELMKLKGYYSNLVTSQLAKSFDKKGSESINEKKSMETDLPENAEESIPIQKDNESADVNKSSQPTSFMEIVRLNWPEWRFILFGGVCSTLMGFSMPLFAVLFGDIIGILSNPDVEFVKSETNLYCIYFVLTGIAIGIATFLQISTLTTAGEKMTERLRALCFQAMIRQEIGWFDDNSNGTGTLCARLSTDTAAVQGATGQRIGSIVQSLATLFLSVGLSMFYQWKLGLVTLAFTPFILIATYSQRRIMQGEDISKTSAMEKSTKLAIEVISSIRTVISLGCEDTFYHQYMNLLAPSVKKAKIGTHFRGFVYGLARSLMFFAYAACMSYGGYLIVEEDLFYGDVFKVSQALIMGTVSIANALAFAPNFERGLNAASKILALLNRVPLVRDSVQQIDMWKNEGDLRFNNVEFTYPSRVDTKVLKDFCMEVAKGKNIGLVGSSGCGKSTCMQLIPRFYDVTGGQISVDLRDIRDVPSQNLRQRIGIVFQEPTLFDRTIFDNIAYGKMFEDVQLEEVVDVAKKSNIHDFIMSLPKGYDTRIGEKGTQLSGGQKQRIAIARALIRNPVILLLDESTAALDAESEKIVQAALDVVKEGRTCITIAHRLSTVINCDIIFVMEAGQIVEQGTHNELMNMNGYYYNLYKLQST